MEKFKGTPAPWRVDRDERLAIISGGKWTGFASVILKPDGWDEDHAHAIPNVNLIAAAPELLAFALDFIEKVESGRTRSTDSYNKAKIAVRKALGED